MIFFIKKRAKEEGEKIGEKRGEKIGEKNKQIEIAKNLLAIGLEVEKIIETTGLTKEEIEKIKEKTI